jgi:hypothetical protein
MKIETNRNTLLAGALALALLAAGLMGARPLYSQPGSPGNVSAVADAVTQAISYQGVLTDNAGNPLNGTFSMRFFVYDDPVTGSLMFDSGAMNVAVSGGLFNAALNVPQTAFDGRGLWLAIQVGAELLSPRQEIQPAPYALSLRPGALVRNAATGTAIRVESQHVGLQGVGQRFGILGQHLGPTLGYAGYFSSTHGVGVFGGSTAMLTSQNLFAPGVWGYSQHGTAIYGQAGPSGVAGYFAGNVAVQGNLHVTGSLTAFDKGGYVFDVAISDDEEPLTLGDVVVVTGVLPGSDPVGIPVFTVSRATQAGTTAVIGVVDRPFAADDTHAGLLDDAPIAPGGHLGVVTLGAFRAIKVDASYGAIQPGDLLIASPNPGYAMRGDEPAVGSVIGKALGALESGTGLIAVLVTLH